MIPQAFTTRDMSEAYKWLHTLPTNVREEMKSMEQVVMLYLRAKRLGGVTPTQEDIAGYKSQLSDSKGSQEFQKTLKNLKQEMDRFDYAQNGGSQAASVTGAQTHAPQFHAQVAPPPVNPTSAPEPTHVPPIPHHDETHATPAQNPFAALRMDPKSRQIINEIRDGLNLSSDHEVVRMSLVLAHKTLRDLLK